MCNYTEKPKKLKKPIKKTVSKAHEEDFFCLKTKKTININQISYPWYQLQKTITVQQCHTKMDCIDVNPFEKGNQETQHFLNLSTVCEWTILVERLIVQVLTAGLKETIRVNLYPLKVRVFRLEKIWDLWRRTDDYTVWSVVIFNQLYCKGANSW